jgi:hypothetical protein
MVRFAMNGLSEPSRGSGQTTGTTLRLSNASLLMVIACVILVAAATLAAHFFATSHSAKDIVYKGKPLDFWFYGTKKDFFNESTRRAAQDAIDDLGTNAVPFLLSKLKEKRGNGPFYFKFYRIMPSFIQGKLQYPISGDDIKAITLDHIGKMRHPIPKHEVQSVADCVLNFRNPRLRMMAF